MNSFQKKHNTAFPSKTKLLKPKSITNQPWTSAGVIKSCRTKSKLLKIKLIKPTQENIESFAQYNITLNRIKRELK